MSKDQSPLTAAPTALDSDNRNADASQKISETQPSPIGKQNPANLGGNSETVDDNSMKHTRSFLGDPEFVFEDANVNLQAGGVHFQVHQHMLRDFRGLKARLDSTPLDEEEGWKLMTLTDRAQDVRGMLLVLYSRPYEPHDFSTATFESAFKLASKYDHLDLRAYTIKQLDHRLLVPVERFRLSRDYDVSHWMSRAITELTWRDKPITVAEARAASGE